MKARTRSCDSLLIPPEWRAACIEQYPIITATRYGHANLSKVAVRGCIRGNGGKQVAVQLVFQNWAQIAGLRCSIRQSVVILAGASDTLMYR